MPEIPGVAAPHGDSEPGLDLVGLRTQPPSLLFTEAYRIAKLEKPLQNMAHRLHGPMGRVPQRVTGVNLCSLTFCAFSPSLSTFSRVPYVFWVTKKPYPPQHTQTQGEPFGYVIPSWQDQQPWQLPT